MNYNFFLTKVSQSKGKVIYNEPTYKMSYEDANGNIKPMVVGLNGKILNVGNTQGSSGSVAHLADSMSSTDLKDEGFVDSDLSVTITAVVDTPNVIVEETSEVIKAAEEVKTTVVATVSQTAWTNSLGDMNSFAAVLASLLKAPNKIKFRSSRVWR